MNLAPSTALFCIKIFLLWGVGTHKLLRYIRYTENKPPPGATGDKVKMANVQDLIAAHLNIASTAIAKVTELYKVWCVVVAGRRPRFVSKVQVLGEGIKSLSPMTWTLKAEMRRQEGKKWVARIDGLCKEYGFKRTFLSAQSIEWGKYGMKKAVFEIQEPGYYQDSDGDYFKVFVSGDALDAECCSKLEVQARFGAVKV